MSEKEKSRYENLIIGIICIAGSVFMFWYFNDFEQSGDTSKRMNAIFAILYNLGGKYLVSAVLAGIGILTTISGIKQLRKS